MKRILTSCAVGVGLLTLAGCGIASRESWDDPGMWRPTGANEVNLQAMIANPDDLYEGRGDRTGSGVIATSTVNRYLTGAVPAAPKGKDGSSSGGGGQSSAPK